MKRGISLLLLIFAFSFVAKGEPTNYLTFNGSDQRVDIPSSEDFRMTSEQSLSVSFWVKATNLTSYPRVISNRYNQNSEGALDFLYESTQGFKLLFPSPDGSNPLDNVLGGSSDEWIHVVAVLDRDNGEARGYLNGVDQNINKTLNSTDIIVSTSDVVFGAGLHSSGVMQFYLEGAIANVRFYREPLSAEDVVDDMNAEDYSSLSADLKTMCVAAYDLTDNYTSLTLTDKTGRGNDGSLVNYDAPPVEVEERTITVSASPTEGGVVTGGETSTTNVTITATANEGYKFVNWTIDGVEISTDATYVDTTEGDKDYVANFVAGYCTSDLSNNHSSRYLTSFTLACGDFSGTVSVNQSSGSAIYYDKTTTEISVLAGETITPTVSWTGSWMHGYLYVDLETDGVFSIDVDEFGVPTDATDLRAYSYYEGVNSKGETVENTTPPTSTPTFTIPAGTPIGSYTARYKVDWNSLDPCGASTIGTNGGAIIDFTIVVEAPDQIVTVSTTGQGDVAINGEDTDELIISQGSVVELEATPEDGSEFVRWDITDAVSGDIIATSTELIYTVDSIATDMQVVANFAYLQLRTIEVETNDASKGEVEILLDGVSYSTIETGRDVEILAAVIDQDADFVYWSDAVTGDIVSESISFTYSGAESVKYIANFLASYTVSYESAENGSIALTKDGASFANGSRAYEGTEIVVKASPVYKYELKQLFVNGVDVIDDCVDSQYTLIVEESTVISALFGEIESVLSFAVAGAGYIEVWSAEDYGGDGAGTPAGDKYSNGETIPYLVNIYIYPFAYGYGEIQSILVNGDERLSDITVDGYSSVEYFVDSKIVDIEATFTGVSTGVEDLTAAKAKVYGAAGSIVIEADGVANVYSLTGAALASVGVDGVTSITMPQGIYIVSINGATYKAIVK